MFEAGDVVWFNSPIAGKGKYHVCLGKDSKGIRFAFLHVNSDAGYQSDLILQDGQIPGLPVSRTGQSVVSFSLVVRMGEEKLKLFKAKKVSQIDGSVAGELVAFARATPVLNAEEKRLVEAALSSLF